MIKRHPVPVSLASQKWSRTSLHRLFEHWLRCYEIFDEDKKHLTHLYEVSYEDYIKNPRKHFEEIANFIGTEVFGPLGEEVEAADVYNEKYFARWGQMLESSRFKSYYRYVARMYERRFEEHGYSLAPLSSKTAFSLDENNPMRRTIAQMLCLGADIYSVPWRADLRLRNGGRLIVNRYCPQKVRTILRNVRRRWAIHG